MLPKTLQSGLMHCYCKQNYDAYGFSSTKVLFADGEQHCKEWYQLYSLQDYVPLFLAIFIALVNWLLQEVFDYIGKKRNTKNLVDNHIYRTVTIFVC